MGDTVQYRTTTGDSFSGVIESNNGNEVTIRYDSARAQLAVLRAQHPAGSSGAVFTGTVEPLPAAPNP